MPSVDLDLLRRATVDNLRVYEAMRRAGTLKEEGEHVVGLADELLRQAGLAYLSGNEDPRPAKEERPKAQHAHGMVTGYIQVQQAYADLKRALLSLARRQLDDHRRSDAADILQAIRAIDPAYGNINPLLKEMYQDAAEDAFGAAKWDAGREILSELLSKSPDRRDARLSYLLSFTRQIAGRVSGSGVLLEELRRFEPAAQALTSFRAAMEAGGNSERLFHFGDSGFEHFIAPFREAITLLESDLVMIATAGTGEVNR